MRLTGFAGLDGLTGGLQPERSYLLYGDVGSGKTSLGLMFLYQGLLAGEVAALVTRRSAASALEQGAALGMDLEAFADAGQLVILEYLPRVVENAMRLRDDAQIYAELVAVLRGDRPQRMVFDPATPLLATPSPSGAIFRARSVVQSFADLGATTLYIFYTPEGQEILASFKDFVSGALRFESAGEGTGRSRVVLERFPGRRGRPAHVDFEVVPGIGLTEATGPGSEPVGAHKVLIVGGAPSEREAFREVLGRVDTIIEADSGADGLAKVGAAAPDIVVVDRDAKGVDGVEFCRTLRQNGVGVPIIVVANAIRRAHDRVLIMAAGADELLERPLDNRILKIKVRNLLRRNQGARKGATLDPSVVSEFERDKTTSTTNLTYFYERIRSEAAYSAENGLSFGVLVLYMPQNGNDPGLAALAGSMIREYDLIYYAPNMVALLLAETDDAGARVFLKRFAEKWTREPVPGVVYRMFDKNADPVQSASQLIEGIAAAQMQTLVDATPDTVGVPPPAAATSTGKSAPTARPPRRV